MAEPEAVLDAALAYAQAGLAVTICHGTTWAERPKAPVNDEWQKTVPTSETIRALYRPGRTVGLVCGRNGIECVDFDCPFETFAEWCALVDSQAPGLLANVYEEKTPRGGIHVVFRSSGTVPGNLKLATVKDPKEQSGWKCIIETRGTGGQFVAAPSPKYEVIQGDLTQLPVLTPDQREVLIDAARSFDQHGPHKALPDARTPPDDDGPGVADDYAAKASVPELLKAHGWKPSQGNHWTRPGKDRGVSATLFDEKVLYVFSSNAAPLEPGRAYSPLQLYAAFHHSGDISAAAKALYNDGFGKRAAPKPPPASEAPAVAPVCEYFAFADLLNFDVKNNPDRLIGRSWLERGAGAFLFALSGRGKSSFVMQFLATLAIGKPFFGLAPVRALKVLYVQDENSRGDMAETTQGFFASLNTTPQVLTERMPIYRLSGQRGDAFIRSLDMLATQHQPDLLCVDPWYAYIASDVSDQKACSDFLRAGFGPLLLRHNCAGLIVHHGTKPSKDPLSRSKWKHADYSYYGAGSAEQTNWARAILVVTEEDDDGTFRLRLSKRGERAGIVDDDGQPVRDIYLKWAQDRICWVPADAPEDPNAAQIDNLVQRSLAAMHDATYTEMELRTLFCEIAGCKQRVTYKRASVFHSALHALCEKTKSPQQPGIHQKLHGLHGVARG